MVEYALSLLSKITWGQNYTVPLYIYSFGPGTGAWEYICFLNGYNFSVHHDAGLAASSVPSWNTDQGVRRARKRRGEQPHIKPRSESED